MRRIIRISVVEVNIPPLIRKAPPHVRLCRFLCWMKLIQSRKTTFWSEYISLILKIKMCFLLKLFFESVFKRHGVAQAWERCAVFLKYRIYSTSGSFVRRPMRSIVWLPRRERTCKKLKRFNFVIDVLDAQNYRSEIRPYGFQRSIKGYCRLFPTLATQLLRIIFYTVPVTWIKNCDWLRVEELWVGHFTKPKQQPDCLSLLTTVTSKI